MASFKLPDNLIGREVERLFSEISGQRGSLRMSPVTGVSFVYGVEPIKPQKVHAYRALWLKHGSLLMVLPTLSRFQSTKQIGAP
jgi:hypothetical protein